MPDVSEMLQTNWVTVASVQRSPTKRAVIIGAGKMTPKEKDGKTWSQLADVLIEMDGRQVTWSPNKDSVKNLSAAWGSVSEGWIGKAINLNVFTIKGEARVIASPSV